MQSLHHLHGLSLTGQQQAHCSPMKRRCLVDRLGLLVFLSLLLHQVHSRSHLYSTGRQRDPYKLNVHIVSHAHIDRGLLDDFVQRCTAGKGAGPSKVDSLLDAVVNALADNPDRTFTYAELALFISWWQQLHPDTQNNVRWLVKEGQFEFANGGLVQHDEATSHYSAMIDQMTLGMRFLQMEFGVSPKIAWQLNGQGHSATEPFLKSMAGFEAIYMRGTDRQDAHIREERKLLELVWRGSISYPTSSNLLMSEFPSSNQTSPDGTHNLTWFSQLPRGLQTPWQDVFTTLNDDPETPGFNLDQVIDAFVETAERLHSYISGNDVLLLLDPDFTQVDPLSWFNSVDKLVHYANRDGRVNAFYSTASRYYAARAAESSAAASATADASRVGHLEGWALKTDDFFPVSVDAAGAAYQTGFYSSRPVLKGMIRRASALLTSIHQVEVLAELPPSNGIVPVRIPAACNGRLFSASKAAPAEHLHGTSVSSRSSSNSSSYGRDSSKQLMASDAAGMPGAAAAAAAAAPPESSTSSLEVILALSHYWGAVSGMQSLEISVAHGSWLHAAVVAAAPRLLQGLHELLYSKIPTADSAAAAAAAAADDKNGDLFNGTPLFFERVPRSDGDIAASAVDMTHLAAPAAVTVGQQAATSQVAADGNPGGQNNSAHIVAQEQADRSAADAAAEAAVVAVAAADYNGPKAVTHVTKSVAERAAAAAAKTTAAAGRSAARIGGQANRAAGNVAATEAVTISDDAATNSAVEDDAAAAAAADGLGGTAAAAAGSGDGDDDEAAAAAADGLGGTAAAAAAGSGDGDDEAAAAAADGLGGTAAAAAAAGSGDGDDEAQDAAAAAAAAGDKDDSIKQAAAGVNNAAQKRDAAADAGGAAAAAAYGDNAPAAAADDDDDEGAAAATAAAAADGNNAAAEADNEGAAAAAGGAGDAATDGGGDAAADTEAAAAAAVADGDNAAAAADEDDDEGAATATAAADGDGAAAAENEAAAAAAADGEGAAAADNEDAAAAADGDGAGDSAAAGGSDTAADIEAAAVDTADGDGAAAAADGSNAAAAADNEVAAAAAADGAGAGAGDAAADDGSDSEGAATDGDGAAAAATAADGDGDGAAAADGDAASATAAADVDGLAAAAAGTTHAIDAAAGEAAEGTAVGADAARERVDSKAASQWQETDGGDQQEPSGGATRKLAQAAEDPRLTRRGSSTVSVAAAAAAAPLTAAISGRRLHRATAAVEMAAAIAAARLAQMAGPMSSMTTPSEVSEPAAPGSSSSGSSHSLHGGAKLSTSKHSSPPLLQMCLLLDQGLCNSSLQLSKSGPGFLVVVYNPLSFGYSWGLRIPVAKDPSAVFTVVSPEGVVVPAQLLPMAETMSALGGADHPEDQEDLAFVAAVPALGHAVYKVLQHRDQPAQEPATGNVKASDRRGVPTRGQHRGGISYDNAEDEENDDSDIAAASDAFVWERQRSAIVSSDVLEVVLKPRSDGITQVRNIVTGAAWQYSHEILLYQGKGLDEATAAVFAATGAPQRAIVTSVTLVKGPVVQEIRETFRDVGVLTTRLWAGRDTLEVQWVIHKLPAKQNYEVLLRYNTGLRPALNVWFTDANGREWQQRRPNFRPSYPLQHKAAHLHWSQHPLGANMYPATTGCTVKDLTHEVSVAIDRAQGVTSPMTGVLEVLLHRSAAAVGRNSHPWLGAQGSSEQLEDPFPAVGTHIVSFEFHAALDEESRMGQPNLLQQDTYINTQTEDKNSESGQQESADEGSAPADTDIGSVQQDLRLHARHMQQILNNPMQLAFSAVPKHRYNAHSTGLNPAAVAPTADDDAGAGASSSVAGVSSRNVHVLTLQWVSCSRLLLRLSHMFQVAEHEKLAVPALVDLAGLLKLDIVRVQEALLFGHQWAPQRSSTPLPFRKLQQIVEGQHKRQQTSSSSSSSISSWSINLNLTQWDPEPVAAAGPWYSFRDPPSAPSVGSDELGQASSSATGSDTLVVLNPMEIRTFYITVRRRRSNCADPKPTSFGQPKSPSQVAFRRAARNLSSMAATGPQAQATVPAGGRGLVPAAANAEAYQQQLLLFDGLIWDPNGVGQGAARAAEDGQEVLRPSSWLVLLLLLRMAVVGLVAVGVVKGCHVAARRAHAESKRAV